MTAVSMKYEVDGLRRRLNKTQRQVIPLAASSALNRASSKALTQVRREVTKAAGVPQKVFKQHFKVFKASKRFLKASIWVGYKFGAALAELSGAARKHQLKRLGVQSQPFIATMPSGHRGRFVRVETTGSRRGGRRRTRGRPGTSPPNLPIVDVERHKVRLDDDVIRAAMDRARRSFIPREFSKIFRKEVGQRLNRLKRRRR